ncbi:zinc finger MYM-type protein 3 [Exaiptasia diaphana]|uniref:Uncharacterized protein n=1 Tax=Exaiptasia diaphana TaxID=2652724 RepID=A0A913Y0E1_EXADI|nr:zinc finger MYM-type protein 3 [Exaiptasia diaphana]
MLESHLILKSFILFEMESEDDFQPAKRFRKARTTEEEKEMLEKAIPKSTRYKNTWAFKLFEDWKSERANKTAILEASSVNSKLEELENLDHDFILMKPKSLNFWVGKFIQEVTSKDGKRFPGATLYQIVAGLKRFLEEHNRNDVNMLDKQKPDYADLRKILDAEMKSAQKDGIVSKKEDKEAISEEEEEKMWSQGHFGTITAKSLLNTVYFYNGKMFGLRANEHRMLRLRDIQVSSNMITYKENTSKTFHGGIKDLKKKPRFVNHICHN